MLTDRASTFALKRFTATAVQSAHFPRAALISGTRCLSTNAEAIGFGPRRAESCGASASGRPPRIDTVVFGWLGARPQYLRKYERLWVDQWQASTTVLPSRIGTILVPSRTLARASASLDLLHANVNNSINDDERRILHVFSNGGFLSLACMLHVAYRSQPRKEWQELLSRTSGIIFDSCPGRIDPKVAAAGVLSAMMRVDGSGLQMHHPRLLSTVSVAFDAYFRLASLNPFMEDVLEAWDKHAPVCPQLYLYSEADTLIPYKEVEEFSDVQEQRGCRVQRQRWHDSAHVQHFRQHPDVYRSLLSEFVGHAIGS